MPTGGTEISETDTLSGIHLVNCESSCQSCEIYLHVLDELIAVPSLKFVHGRLRCVKMSGSNLGKAKPCLLPPTKRKISIRCTVKEYRHPYLLR